MGVNAHRMGSGQSHLAHYSYHSTVANRVSLMLPLLQKGERISKTEYVSVKWLALHYCTCPNQTLTQRHSIESISTVKKVIRHRFSMQKVRRLQFHWVMCCICIDIFRQLMVVQNALMIFICIKLFSPLRNIMDK